MAVGTVTTVAGAGATVPDDTSFPVLESNDGGMPLVAVGYVDGSSESQSLVTENGVLIRGTATLGGVTSDTNDGDFVADTATSTTLLASNAARVGMSIVNTSSADLYVAFGGTAGATNCVLILAQGEELSACLPGLYTGEVTGVWASDPDDGGACTNEW